MSEVSLKTYPIYDVIIARQLLSDAHVSDVLLVDVPCPVHLDTQEDLVLSRVTSDVQSLQLKPHLIHYSIQLVRPAEYK